MYESNGVDGFKKSGLVFNSTGFKVCAIRESKHILPKRIERPPCFDKNVEGIHDENKTLNQKNSSSLWNVIYPIVNIGVCLTIAFPVCIIYSCIKDISALRDRSGRSDRQSVSGISQKTYKGWWLTRFRLYILYLCRFIYFIFYTYMYIF